MSKVNFLYSFLLFHLTVLSEAENRICSNPSTVSESKNCLVSKYCAKVNDPLCISIFEDSNSTFDKTPQNKKPSSGAVYGYGVLSVTVISLTSVIGVGLLPLMSKNFYHKLLTGLIGLAVGSLVASAIFHLIPSAFLLGEYDPNHSYLNTSLTIWFGIHLFFVIERLLKVFIDYRSRSKGLSKFSWNQADSSNGVETSKSITPSSNPEQLLCSQNGKSNNDRNKAYECSGQSLSLINKPEPEIIKSSKNSPIATVAWMILFGDGVHNFIDGLSIGAAFTESILTGISVSVAVFCEEFPHELGDFAVLLNSGMSIKQAMVYNFLSACTCYLGLVFGILLSGLDFGTHIIFALAGGMFLYIALADMIPELNETMNKSSKNSVLEALSVFLLQNIGISLGIGALFILAKYQNEFTFESL